jgi:hypothetical protein
MKQFRREVIMQPQMALGDSASFSALAAVMGAAIASDRASTALFSAVAP